MFRLARYHACLIFGLVASAPIATLIAQSPQPSRGCNGNSSGGATLSDRVTLAYALTNDTSGVRLNAAILARGQPGWDRRGRPGQLPLTMPAEPGDKPSMLAGTTADTFALMFDRANEIAWVGGRRVRLRGMNVVLLDRADGVGGPPVLLPLVRVDSALAIPGSSCEPPRSRDAAVARMDASRGALFRSPEVREFLKP